MSFAWFSGASYYANEYVRMCVFIQKQKLYLFINFPICVINCYLLIVYLMPGIRCYRGVSTGAVMFRENVP
jgi:hypothetical protein